MKKRNHPNVTKALILLLILPMIVFANQTVPRVGAEETEKTEQTTEETKKAKESTEESTKKSKEKDETKESVTEESTFIGPREAGEVEEEIKLKEGERFTVPNEEGIERRSEKVQAQQSKKKQARAPQSFSGDLIEHHIFDLADHKATYGAAIAQANDDYNTVHGFNPLVNVQEVTTYAQFLAAYQTEAVTKIIMKNDIISPANVGTIYKRESSIEIDGQGHTLELNRGNLGIADADPINKAVFHIHDVVCSQNARSNNDYSSGYQAFINSDGYNETNVASSTVTQNWYFRIGNVSTAMLGPANQNCHIPGGFGALDQAEVTFYGFNKIHTGKTIFSCGSVVVEENTVLRTGIYSTIGFASAPANRIRYVPHFWYKTIDGESTGKSREFTQQKNSYVYFAAGYVSLTGGQPYRYSLTIHDEFSKITVDDGAWFNVGTNYAFYMDTATLKYTPKEQEKRFEAKENAKVNILSYLGMTGLPAIVSKDAAKNRKYTLDIDMNKPEYALFFGFRSQSVYFENYQNLFVLNAPKIFELGQEPFARITSLNDGKLQVLNSDINFYRSTGGLGSTFDYGAQDIAELTVRGSEWNPSNVTNITSSDLGLQTRLNAFTPVLRARLNNIGQKPMVKMNYITDAQYTYDARVVTGTTVTGKFDDYGMPIFTETPANASQVRAEFTDTRTNVRGPITLTGGGIASYTDTQFQIAGKEVEARAQMIANSFWSDTEKTTVLDVTPPEPIKVTGNKISDEDTNLSATVEPNAKVFISVNDGTPVAAGTANGAGAWSYTIPGGGYNVGDKIQIFLEDTTAPLPGNFSQTGLEHTRTTDGNRNPKDGDVTYRDATFKQATIYHVKKANEVLTFHIRQMAVTPDAPIKEIVTPKNGYVTLKNTNDVTFDIQVKSGVESTGTPGDSQEAPFKDVSLLIPDPDTNKFLDLSTVIPSNYEYAGYAVTDTNVNHQFASASTGNYQYDFSAGVYEKWITIFIKPNRGANDTVGLYHWDYELNKFGQIK
ncbi:hypothetical protein NRIC_35790 [Enterococcus florum]|uniref:Bacterial Ig domain-containing protein n=1 Tax=Enterococcus florum TaxID=2480627 RepID=A0A4P5PH81_9ENTE|nr:pectate lyase-like adhesive domain-containing protein [Enterococcus florum]GCF95688.1 hypothetical protein NRIC_35790 [Enterococcus florum]